MFDASELSFSVGVKNHEGCREVEGKTRSIRTTYRKKVRYLDVSKKSIRYPTLVNVFEYHTRPSHLMLALVRIPDVQLAPLAV